MNIADDFWWSLGAGIIVTLLAYCVGRLTKKWSDFGAALISSVVGVFFVYFFGPPNPDHIFNAGDGAAHLYSEMHLVLCGIAWIASSAVTAYFLPAK